jgi:hypothetical protein
MLRTLARAAAILVLGATVAGGLYLAVASRGPSLPEAELTQATSASRNGHSGRRRPGPPDGRSSNRGERHGREEASLGHGMAGMVGTALQVAFVGAVVVGLQKRSRRRNRQQGREAN